MRAKSNVPASTTTRDDARRRKLRSGGARATRARERATRARASWVIALESTLGGARRARSPRTNARDAAARRARLAEVGLRGGGRGLGGTARDESRLLAAPGGDDAVVVLDAEADDDAPIFLD